jgi:tRNA uridine 5-carboxymethylaminomethyl modification enzyme
LFDGDLSDAILVERVVSAARYSQYSQRHERQFKDLNATESMQIPKEIDYKSLSGLSGELATKLSTLRPSTVGHAMKIEGMTPAAGIIVMAAVKLQNESAHLK